MLHEPTDAPRHQRAQGIDRHAENFEAAAHSPERAVHPAVVMDATADLLGILDQAEPRVPGGRAVRLRDKRIVRRSGTPLTDLPRRSAWDRITRSGDAVAFGQRRSCQQPGPDRRESGFVIGY